MSDVTATDITRLIAAVDAEMRMVGDGLCKDCLREAVARARALAVESYQNMVGDGHAPEDAAEYAIRLATRLAAEVTSAEHHSGAPSPGELRDIVVRTAGGVGRGLWGRPQ